MKQAFFLYATALFLTASAYSATAPKNAPPPVAPVVELPASPPKKQTLIPPPASPDRPAAEPPAGVIIPAATPSAPPPTAIPPTPPAVSTPPKATPAPMVPAPPAATVAGAPAASVAGTTAITPAAAPSAAMGVAPPSNADLAAIQQQLTETEVPPAEPDHIISEGDTLGAIAAKVYGNEAYGAVLTNYNAVDAKKLKIGQTIKTPAIAQMLNECGFTARIPEETLTLLRVKKVYAAEVAPKLNELKGTMKKGDPVPEDLKKQMKDLRADLDKVRQGIIAKCAGAKPPESTLLQFRTASDILAFLSKGDFGKKDNNIQEVHTRLGLGIAYGIFWARSGFK